MSEAGLVLGAMVVRTGSVTCTHSHTYSQTDRQRQTDRQTKRNMFALISFLISRGGRGRKGGKERKRKIERERIRIKEMIQTDRQTGRQEDRVRWQFYVMDTKFCSLQCC